MHLIIAPEHNDKLKLIVIVILQILLFVLHIVIEKGRDRLRRAGCLGRAQEGRD